ncbi:MAG: hypothetical protein K8I30_08010 [Anaerolineae bacterium]|nr:hypothetical protein [Anaerolineae bacterium]
MAYLLGLDISTTGAKALIIDESGKVIASHTTPQPISTPKPLWSEQNPADWWNGMAASIRAAHRISQTITAGACCACTVTGRPERWRCSGMSRNNTGCKCCPR